MKKATLVLVMFSLLFFVLPERAGTSNTVETSLFPVKIAFNDQELSFDDPILNYNGKAYVPVRTLAEWLGGGVSYDDEEHKIDIYLPSPMKNKRAVLSSSTHDGDWKLSIHTAKKTYRANEPLEIWSNLVYTGEEELEIGHGNPLLKFYIIDAEGNKAGESNEDVLRYSKFSKNDLMTSVLDWAFIKSLNFYKSGMDPKRYKENYEKPWLLDQGKYTVGVLLEYTERDKTRHSLSAEIPIEVNS